MGANLKDRGRVRLYPSVKGDLVIVKSGPQEGLGMGRNEGRGEGLLNSQQRQLTKAGGFSEHTQEQEVARKPQFLTYRSSLSRLSEAQKQSMSAPTVGLLPVNYSVGGFRH